MAAFGINASLWSLQDLQTLHAAIKASLLSGIGSEIVSYSIGGKSVVKARGTQMSDLLIAVEQAIIAKHGGRVSVSYPQFV